MPGNERRLERRTEFLENLIEPTVTHLGFNLWGVEQTGTGTRSRVCIYIDSPKGITVDDCETVSRQVFPLLAVEDGLAGTYVLEVSSPGLDRRLFKPDHFECCVGEEVDVQLHLPLEGSRRFRGKLTLFEENTIELEVDENRQSIPLDRVRRAHVIPSFT